MKKKIIYLGRDEKMDSIGIPINPNRHAKQSKKSEFFTDLAGIFTSSEGILGIFISIILAILFTINWGFYLISKYLLRIDLEKPAVKKKRR